MEVYRRQLKAAFGKADSGYSAVVNITPVQLPCFKVSLRLLDVDACVLDGRGCHRLRKTDMNTFRISCPGIRPDFVELKFSYMSNPVQLEYACSSQRPDVVEVSYSCFPIVGSWLTVTVHLYEELIRTCSVLPPMFETPAIICLTTMIGEDHFASTAWFEAMIDNLDNAAVISRGVRASWICMRDDSSSCREQVLDVILEVMERHPICPDVSVHTSALTAITTFVVRGGVCSPNIKARACAVLHRMMVQAATRWALQLFACQLIYTASRSSVEWRRFFLLNGAVADCERAKALVLNSATGALKALCEDSVCKV